MSSCRKPEIHNDLPNTTKIKLKCGQLFLFYHVLKTFQLIFKNKEKNVFRFEPQSLGFEATEHLRNRMRKENCRKPHYIYRVHRQFIWMIWSRSNLGYLKLCHFVYCVKHTCIHVYSKLTKHSETNIHLQKSKMT